MEKVVADTSALISLGVSGVMDKCLEIAEISIPRAVAEELEEIAAYEDKEGKAAVLILDFLRKGRIAKVELREKSKAERLLSNDVDRGEAECFALCLENDIKKLLMDDVDAGYSLEGLTKAEGIKIRISVALISALVKKKMMDKNRAIEAVRRMANVREWEGGVLEVLAKRYFGI